MWLLTLPNTFHLSCQVTANMTAAQCMSIVTSRERQKYLEWGNYRSILSLVSCVIFLHVQYWVCNAYWHFYGLLQYCCLIVAIVTGELYFKALQRTDCTHEMCTILLKYCLWTERQRNEN
jgi:hypothetical protein